MKKISLKAISFAAVLLLGSLAFAGSENSQIQKGIELHNLSRSAEGEESDAMIDESMKTLEPFIEKDTLACAYYGSALTIKAGNYAKKSPVKALMNLKKGSKLIDEAVKKDSDNLELRILRLENGIDVSRGSPVKRYTVIREDVDYFIAQEKISLLGDELKAEVYLFCGHYYLDSKDSDNARKYFELAYNASPDSKFGKDAKEMFAQ